MARFAFLINLLFLHPGCDRLADIEGGRSDMAIDSGSPNSIDSGSPNSNATNDFGPSENNSNRHEGDLFSDNSTNPGSGSDTDISSSRNDVGSDSTESTNCGTSKWACWRMPNPPGTGPNTQSYTVNNGVVHDSITGLDWQQTSSNTTYNNVSAISYCDNLVLGGYRDWRVPTRIELMSIMDWTRSPTTDAVFSRAGGFHKTGSNWILTIRQAGAGKGKDYAWAFNMSDGIVSNAKSAASQDKVRCVRGNGAGEKFSEPAVAPPNQYTVISDEEVQDNYTKLIWQRNGTASGRLNWAQAVAYCSNLNLGGHVNWRLPTVRELATLVDETLVAPAINKTIFPNTQFGARSNNWYWASHHSRNSNTVSWGLNFDDGFTGFNSGASGSWNYWTVAWAKCVR